MGYLVVFVAFLASAFIVDYLARERGWNRHRWVVAAVILGPFAIPLVYLVQAASALRKMVHIRQLPPVG